MTRPTPERFAPSVAHEDGDINCPYGVMVDAPHGEYVFYEDYVEVKRERDEAREAMAWRPIDTAPKDGKQIIIAVLGGDVGQAFWHDGSECYGHRGKVGWFWSEDASQLLTAANADNPPEYPATHWMPLPQPPEARSREGGGL